MVLYGYSYILRSLNIASNNMKRAQSETCTSAAVLRSDGRRGRWTCNRRSTFSRVPHTIGVRLDLVHSGFSLLPRLQVTLAPVPMNSRHGDAHVPDVRHFLALEAIEVGLDRGRGVFQVLCRRLQGVLQLRYMILRLANAVPPRSLRIDVHNTVQRVRQRVEKTEARSTTFHR